MPFEQVGSLLLPAAELLGRRREARWHALDAGGELLLQWEHVCADGAVDADADAALAGGGGGAADGGGSKGKEGGGGGGGGSRKRREAAEAAEAAAAGVAGVRRRARRQWRLEAEAAYTAVAVQVAVPVHEVARHAAQVGAFELGFSLALLTACPRCPMALTARGSSPPAVPPAALQAQRLAVANARAPAGKRKPPPAPPPLPAVPAEVQWFKRLLRAAALERTRAGAVAEGRRPRPLNPRAGEAGGGCGRGLGGGRFGPGSPPHR
jgi:hypothetical protein